MASITSPSALPASSLSRWAPTPCRRGFACPYLRRRCCCFGHSLEEVEEESEFGRDHLLPCCDDAALAGLGSMERVVDDVQHVPQELVQNWDVEPIVGVPVPPIWEPFVEGVHLAPQERVQKRARELVVDLAVPQVKEDVPVPRPWRNLAISFSLFLRCVSKNKFRSRSHWCCGSWRKLGLLYSRCLRSMLSSLCLRSVLRNQLWSKFLWCPRPWRKVGK